MDPWLVWLTSGGGLLGLLTAAGRGWKAVQARRQAQEARVDALHAAHADAIRKLTERHEDELRRLHEEHKRDLRQLTRALSEAEETTEALECLLGGPPKSLPGSGG